jgi:hypothetical protein
VHFKSVGISMKPTTATRKVTRRRPQNLAPKVTQNIKAGYIKLNPVHITSYSIGG